MRAHASGAWLMIAACAQLGLACRRAPDESAVARLDQSLIGAEPVAAGAWPNVVGLDSGCTGTLLAPDLLVTAGHCVQNATRAFTGDSFELELDPASGQESATLHASGHELAIRECVAYPGAEIGSGNDLAYCVLKQPLKGVPIAMPTVGCTRDAVRVGAAVTLVGFGLDRPDGGEAGVKRVAEASLTQQGRELVIGDETVGTCRGDSGGPALVRVATGAGSTRSSWQLLAVMSSGLQGECGVGYYTDLARYMDWLERASGRDLTPCGDALGQWQATAECREAALDKTGKPAAAPGRPLASCGEGFEPASVEPRAQSGCSVPGALQSHGQSRSSAALMLVLCLSWLLRRRSWVAT